MEEKRYFCDWLDNKANLVGEKLFYKIVIAFLIITTAVSSLLYANVIYPYDNNIEENYKKLYDYLEKIDNTIIVGEEGIINIAAMPKEVIEYKIIYQDDKIVFKYSVKNDIIRNNQFPSTLEETVNLSKDFQVLSKENNLGSKEEREKISKQFASYTRLGIMTSLVIFFAIMFLILVSLTISLLHKLIDQKNL